MRYKIVVQFDGTAYCGFQVQPNGISVQQVLTEAFQKIGNSVAVTGSGRTDSGVHARAMVCHVDMTSTVPEKNIAKAVNAHLPSDVSVLSAEIAEDGFHARYSAKQKTYAYRLYVSDIALPLKERYSVRIKTSPDLDKMREGAKEFIGKKDFRAFLASGSSVQDTVREIYSIEIENQDQDITVKITGNGFLYNMVRIIVGTLLDVGYGKKTPEQVKEIIKSRERKNSGKTLPAKGLELFSVEYSNKEKKI